nr:hypothetical protein [Tanacetum cinerariifolium]
IPSRYGSSGNDPLLNLEVDVLFIFKGARPNRRLRPDAFEAKAECRYDVPKDIYQYFDEHDMFIKELREKNVAQDKMLNKMDNYFEGMNPCNMPGPMKALIEVHEHYGLSDFSVFQNTQGFPQGGPKLFTMQASSSFLTWPKSPRLIRPRLSSRCRFDYPPSYLATLHIAAPMAQQGFAPRSSTYQTGPSHNRDVGRVNPDAMHREKREIHPSKKFQSPFTALTETTVAPKKGANNMRKTTGNANVSPFDLGNTGIDLNAQVEEVMFMGSRATNEYISFHNVDPNKVVHGDYVDCMTFLGSPEAVFLDCYIRGFTVEEQFWQGLIPLLCKGANYKENNPNQIG